MAGCRGIWPWRRSGSRSDGGVAAEFALVVPVIVLVAAGIADFGTLAAKSAALAGAARIGAEYARHHPTDTAGIQYSMQSSMGFVPEITFPASFARDCECDDRTPIACSESCATAGRPGPNRMFLKIIASQAFTPLVPWPGISAAVTATAEVRLQ